eukprot:TRINITY_DN29347_c0_g1_i1.p1 TRINITY_DN29347_c0_g1~~TRINITY_DN29347_c0_g1_i1.p1  ORF type:complete len:838 (+),score=117.49 TRINITY_DN29347_c0_g1_i1:58-2571(+)
MQSGRKARGKGKGRGGGNLQPGLYFEDGGAVVGIGGPGLPGRGGRGGGGGGKARSSRASKGSFPWINSQLISASESGSVGHLLEVIRELLPHMNLVNLSTAAHRLGKLAANDPQSQQDLRKHPVMRELLRLVCIALSALKPGEAQPQSISNVAWSLATLRHVDRPTIKALSALAVMSIEAFKPFELSTTLWALTKLGTVECVLEMTRPVFQVAADRVLVNVEEFGFRCLSTIVWSFATARQRNARLFRCVASQMTLVAQHANCQEMANTVWAFGTADFHDEALFAELAERAQHRLHEFKAQEISNLLWGFASNGFVHEGLLRRAAVLVKDMDLKAQHLANILWAFARVRPRHPLTQEVVLSLLPACSAQLNSFKPQEVASTLLAVAKSFTSLDSTDPPPTLPIAVAAFIDHTTPWALSKLHEFSSQSLANVALAHVMLRTAKLSHRVGQEVEAVLDMVVEVVLVRCSTQSLEATSMVHLIKGFAAAVPEWQTSRHVPVSMPRALRALARCLMAHVRMLRTQDMQILSRACASLTSSRCGVTPEEVQAQCLLIAEHIYPWEPASAAVIPPPLPPPPTIGGRSLPIPPPHGNGFIHEDARAVLDDPFLAGDPGIFPGVHPVPVGLLEAPIPPDHQTEVDMEWIRRENQLPIGLHSGLPPMAFLGHELGGAASGQLPEGEGIPSTTEAPDRLNPAWASHLPAEQVHISNPMYDLGFTKSLRTTRNPDMNASQANVLGWSRRPMPQADEVCPYVEYQMGPRNGHADFNLRCFVKNSFLHFHRGEDDEEDFEFAASPQDQQQEPPLPRRFTPGAGSDDLESCTPSQRASSVPTRFRYQESSS